jgi:hypothetical protein
MDDELRTSSDNVIRMLREAVPEIARELTGVVRDVAKRGAEIARVDADAEQLVPPGRSHRATGHLLAGITYGSRGTTGLIRETATRNGYTYPGVFEFSREYKQGRMRRPFLIPARDELLPYAIEAINNGVEVAIEQLEADHGR